MGVRFIYGRAGIGKTHLLHSIGNYCKEKQNENLNVYYTTANDFIDEFMRSTQNKDIDSMKAKFKSIDITESTGDVTLLASAEEAIKIKTSTGDISLQGAEWYLNIWSAIPLVNIVLIIMATRSILKDEALVRAADRLR